MADLCKKKTSECIAVAEEYQMQWFKEKRWVLTGDLNSGSESDSPVIVETQHHMTKINVLDFVI